MGEQQRRWWARAGINTIYVGMLSISGAGELSCFEAVASQASIMVLGEHFKLVRAGAFAETGWRSRGLDGWDAGPSSCAEEETVPESEM